MLTMKLQKCVAEELNDDVIVVSVRRSSLEIYEEWRMKICIQYN